MTGRNNWRIVADKLCLIKLKEEIWYLFLFQLNQKHFCLTINESLKSVRKHLLRSTTWPWCWVFKRNVETRKGRGDIMKANLCENSLFMPLSKTFICGKLFKIWTSGWKQLFTFSHGGKKIPKSLTHNMIHWVPVCFTLPNKPQENVSSKRGFHFLYPAW